jgi:hypothetical protein
VVIGGTSLFGGEGNLFASLVGALIIATLRNGLNVLGVYAFWQQVAIGVILIAAVYLDRFRRRRRGELPICRQGHRKHGGGPGPPKGHQTKYGRHLLLPG